MENVEQPHFVFSICHFSFSISRYTEMRNNPVGLDDSTTPYDKRARRVVAAPRKLLSPFGGPSMIRLVREFLSKAPTLRLPFTS